MQNQGEVPAFGSVSVETIQEKCEIFVLADINGRVSQFIRDG